MRHHRLLAHLLCLVLAGWLVVQSAVPARAALEFDGSVVQLELADLDGWSSTSNFTMSFWINASTWGQNAYLLFRTNSFNVRISNVASSGGVSFFDSAGNGCGAQGSTPATNTWTHVGIVYTGTAGTRGAIYFDGVAQPLTACNAVTSPLATGTGSVLIGASVTTQLTAKLYNIKFWRGISMNQQQILAEMRHYRPRIHDGLIMWLPLDGRQAGFTVPSATSPVIDRSPARQRQSAVTGAGALLISYDDPTGISYGGE